MTKRGYVVTLTMAGCVAALIVAYAALAGLLPPLSTLWEPDPAKARFGAGGFLYNYLWWIVGICLVGQILDSMMVFRRFAEAEAQERAKAEQTQAASQASQEQNTKTP